MHHPRDRISHTTAFVTPVMEHWLEREIAQWVHPMKDRSDNPSHHEVTSLTTELHISLLCGYNDQYVSRVYLKKRLYPWGQLTLCCEMDK